MSSSKIRWTIDVDERGQIVFVIQPIDRPEEMTPIVLSRDASLAVAAKVNALEAPRRN